jgi:iron complex outermembrane receptor protein
MSAIILASLLAIAAHLPAAAQEMHAFNVSAQDPAGAIRAFGVQAGVQILASADDLKGKKFNPVSGDISTEEALKVLLAGTGLDHRYVGERAVALVSNDPDQNPEQKSLTGRAQDVGLEEVIVTARRVEENLQRVPVTISVLPAEALESRGDFSIWDLEQTVPGLNVNGSLSREFINFTIRGQTQSPGTLFPAVITYFSEVPVPRITSGQFYDLGDVQVLKGPQGTLFGRVTTGGAILLSPIKPSDTFEGYGTVRLGDYGLRSFQGATNFPINDWIAMRFAGEVNRRDGYTHNIYDGRDLDEVSYESGRVGLLLKPTSNLENYTVASFNHINTDGGGSVLGGFNPNDWTPALAARVLTAYNQQRALGVRTVNVGSPGPLFQDDGNFSNSQVWWLTNTTTYENAEKFTIKNIFGYIRDKESFGQAALAPPAPYYTNRNAGPSFFNEQFSDELQAQGRAFGDDLKYTIGTYWDLRQNPAFQDYGYVLEKQGILTIVTPNDATTRSRAGYAQANYDLSSLVQGLKINAGARYSSDTVEASSANYLSFGLAPTPIPADQCLSVAEVAARGLLAQGVIPTQGCTTTRGSSSAFTYTAGLDYQLNPNTFLYFSLRRGYRPGGVNSTSGGIVPAVYGPEYDLSRELGVRAEWNLGGVAFRTNFSAFLDNGTQVQQQIYTVTASNLVVTGVANSARSTVKGIELSGAVVPFKGFTADVDWAYTRAAYDTSAFTAAQIAASCPADPSITPPAPNGIVCPLQAFNYTPENVVKVAAHYALPLGDSIGTIIVGGDWYYTSKVATSDSRYPVTPTAPYGAYIPDYSIVNVDVSWKNFLRKPLEWKLFVTNATNKTYIQYAASFLDAGSLGVQQTFYGPPRMFGVSLKYTFGR